MKIICIGRNYAAHAKELNHQVDEEPVIFMKPKNALVKINNQFFYPEFTNDLHYECELVLKICNNGKYISEYKAHRFYDSITTGIDFTCRDIQRICIEKGLPWEKAKSWDGSATVGKFIPVEKFDNLDNINFCLYKNKELVQQGNSKDMIHSFDKLVSYISNFFTINIGDLIFTGTPAGVGPLVVGDELDSYIENEQVLNVLIK